MEVWHGLAREIAALVPREVESLRAERFLQRRDDLLAQALDCEPLVVSGWLRAWHRYQLGQLSEVLGGCCEKELITRTIRPS